jgi:large subunit ribosomal protein L2
MALKKFKPDTPSKRGTVIVDKSALWKGKPEKSLTVGKLNKGGRNNLGKRTALRGGGVKNKYRIIDFKRNKDNMNAVVERIEYDPNRSSFIALVKYEDGTLSYIIAPQKLEVGEVVSSGDSADINIGNCLPLKNIPIGTIIHNVEMKPGKGGQLARAAGSYVQLTGKDAGYAFIKLKSGVLYRVRIDCRATIGAVSNPDNQNVKLGKAGRNRWLNRRPHVRGVAMNPVDHPLGGGEGKTSGGRHPVNKNGKLAKGKRTRRNKATDKYILRKRHNA